MTHPRTERPSYTTRLFALGTLVLVCALACDARSADHGQPRTGSQNQASDRADTDALADTLALAGAQLQPGLYLGPWRVAGDARTHWLVFVFGVDSFRGLVYNPPGFDEICVAQVDSLGSVHLETASLSGSVPYQLAVDGSLTRRGLRGKITFSSSQLGATSSSFEMEHVPLGTAMADSAHIRSGLYANVRLHGETGDLLGDELLLVRSERRLVAAYTSYQGVADGPYIADSVTAIGNGVSMVGHFGTREKSTLTLIFNNRFRRVKSLPELFSTQAVVRCGSPD